MRYKIKEPKKLIAVLILVYIVVAICLIANDFSKRIKSVPREITGRASGAVRINLVSGCTINLKSEYNFISLCANVSNLNISNVLGSLAGQYSFVLKWNKSNQEFITYSPEAATNQFDKFRLNESYFIFMNNDATLSIMRHDIGNMNITLIPEFNSPSYPYLFTSNVSRYIAKIRENVSFVLKWNKSNQEFITYSPEAATNQFDSMSMGEGQFIVMLNDGVLRYNTSELQS